MDLGVERRIALIAAPTLVVIEANLLGQRVDLHNGLLDLPVGILRNLAEFGGRGVKTFGRSPGAVNDRLPRRTARRRHAPGRKTLKQITQGGGDAAGSGKVERSFDGLQGGGLLARRPERFLLTAHRRLREFVARALEIPRPQTAEQPLERIKR